MTYGQYVVQKLEEFIDAKLAAGPRSEKSRVELSNAIDETITEFAHLPVGAPRPPEKVE